MARGISTGGDVLKTDALGQPLNNLWREFQDAMRLKNEARDNFASLLSFRTSAVAENVAQTTAPDDFEEASEFGVPKAIRLPGTYLTLAADFKWFDAASRFTWRALVDMDSEQIASVNAAILEADNRLVFRAIMGRLFNNAVTVNGEGLNVYPLYAADGAIPPEHAGITFDGNHTHYLSSGAAVVDGNDVVELTRHVQHHGHGNPAEGGRVVVFCHPNEAEVLRGVTKGASSSVDFIPSESAPAYLTTQALVGDRPPAALGRIPVMGSLGSAWVSENALVPSGYLAAVAIYGGNDRRNTLMLREHPRPELRGLRLIPGSDKDYPLQDSYASRGFGTGIRQRGGAAVMKIGTGAYAAPAEYSTVIA